MKKKKYNLSIVIPLYNSAFTLKETIESLNHKSLYFLNDIVIYNDGSTDDSLKILKKLKKINTKIRYFTSKVNRGGAYARNFAIKKTKNELLKIVDADNIVDPKSLIALYNCAIRNKFRAHYQTAKFFNTDKKKITSQFDFSKYYGKNFIYKDYLTKLFPLDNFLFTKKQWLLAGKYNEKTHWDTQDFSVRFSKKIGDIPIVKNTFYFHRRFVRNYKSYYERQESSGENFFNSYKLFETIFDNLNIKKISFLLEKNIFMTFDVIFLLKTNKYKKTLIKNRNLKLLNDLVKIMTFVKKQNLKKSKFYLKKYLSHKEIKITDLILFLIIRTDQFYSTKQYNEFKRLNNFFSFIKIFKKYPNSSKLIIFYIKFLSFIILKKLR